MHVFVMWLLLREHFTDACLYQYTTSRTFNGIVWHGINFLAEIPKLLKGHFAIVLTRFITLVFKQVPLVTEFLLRLCLFLSKILEKYELHLTKILDKNSSDKNINLTKIFVGQN